MSLTHRPDQELFEPDGKLNLRLFSLGAARALRGTLAIAKETQWECVRSPHMFMSLLDHADGQVDEWAAQAGFDPEQMLSKFREMFFDPTGNTKPVLALNREFISDNLIGFLRTARERAVEQGHEQITTLDLLVALLTARVGVVLECLKLLELEPEELIELVEKTEMEMGGEE